MVQMPIIGIEEALWILGNKYKSYSQKNIQKIIKDYIILINCIFDILESKPKDHE